MEAFIGKHKFWNKRTTTSPSRRHLGHDKAFLKPQQKDEHDLIGKHWDLEYHDILQLHLNIINCGISNKYIFTQWEQIVNVIIFKEPGNFKIHHLQVIHIYMADYNLMLAVKYQELLQHGDLHNLLHPGQHGGQPSHTATLLTFLKELKYDISCYLHKTLINYYNNAASCYNRIIVSLASVICQKLGSTGKLSW